MDVQNIFKRYELKYLLTPLQKERILSIMAPHMLMDQFGRSSIRNLYFDTDTWRLIRHSIEKPVYKEKLRLRSYRTVKGEEPVYAELKKKYQSVVYKRRLPLPEKAAMDWLLQKTPPPENSQIAREIDYFLHFYKTLRPVVYLSYEREAYYSLNGDDFRVTFDDHILCRRDGLSLLQEPGGTPLLPPDKILMEIKTSAAIPLWMTRALTEERIFKTSFSKYGTAYETLIYPSLKRSDIL